MFAKLVKETLEKAYARVFLQDPDGYYTALILEFPGCVADGQTLADAADALDRMASAWVISAAAQGQALPPPFEEQPHGVRGIVRDALAWRKQRAEAGP